MKNFIKIVAILVVVLSPNYVFGQTPERSRLTVPSSTSSSWFRGATSTCALSPTFSATGDTNSGVNLRGSDVVDVCANGAVILSATSTAVTSTVPIISQQDIGSVSNWDGGQFRISGATNANKGVSIGFSTTDNYGYIYSREIGTAQRPLLIQPQGGGVAFGTTSAIAAAISITTMQLADTWTFGWSDVSLSRDAANTLAQRNGTNAQMFSPYGSYTNTSNYYRVDVGSDTSGGFIGTSTIGTGVGKETLRFYTGGVSRWKIDPSGHLLAWADNTYDIGASGSEPRSVRAKTSFGGASATGTLVTNDAQTVANDAVISISDGANNYGLVTITINSDDTGVLVWLRGTQAPVIVSDPSSLFSITATTPGKVNIYYSLGYKLENKLGSSRNVRIVRLGV